MKIDPFGFALEQYDAIGRLRPASVERKTKLADGTEIEGIEGLRDYLLNNAETMSSGSLPLLLRAGAGSSALRRAIP